VYERPDHKDWSINGYATEDGRYLVIDLSQARIPTTVSSSTSSQPAAFVSLCPEGEARYTFVGNDGGRFYFLTTLDARADAWSRSTWRLVRCARSSGKPLMR